MENLKKLSGKELKDKGIEMGLKLYGTKAQMISKIIKHIEDLEAQLVNAESNANADESFNGQLNLSKDEELILNDVNVNPDSDSIDSSYVCGDDGKNDKKRKRNVVPYKLLGQHINVKNAVDTFINECDTWRFERTRDTREGIKDFYICKYPGCQSKNYILHTDDDESVTLWTNSHDHDHSQEFKAKEWGINEITKLEIEKLYKSKVTGATRIIYALREMMDKKSQTYVAGLEEPTPIQINNYVNNVIKKKIVKPNFSYSDLAKWVNEHKDVPDDEHEPYVIDSYINVNDKVPNTSVIRIALSTRYLVSLAKRKNHICADTTWKTNWQGNILFRYRLIR